MPLQHGTKETQGCWTEDEAVLNLYFFVQTLRHELKCYQEQFKENVFLHFQYLWQHQDDKKSYCCLPKLPVLTWTQCTSVVLGNHLPGKLRVILHLICHK